MKLQYYWITFFLYSNQISSNFKVPLNLYIYKYIQKIKILKKRTNTHFVWKHDTVSFFSTICFNWYFCWYVCIGRHIIFFKTYAILSEFLKYKDIVTGSSFMGACYILSYTFKFWKRQRTAPSDLVLFKAETVQKGAIYILISLILGKAVKKK